ncbi:MAG TPA: hypothetical protein VG496_02845 [Myxococcales bacterium]|nr:hypothetical protein [Myxococcales bacterium]
MSLVIARRTTSLSLAVAAIVIGLARDSAAQAPAESTQSAGTVAPAAQEPAVPWTRRLYSWASVGTTFAYGQTYGSANVGAGILMKYGIAPNVEVGYAFGNTPTLWSVRPGVTWFLPSPLFRPYVGTYYTHWFVGSGFPDQDGIGGRAGFSIGRAISLGVTYDHAFGCSVNCDAWTPQISAGVSF